MSLSLPTAQTSAFAREFGLPIMALDAARAAALQQALAAHAESGGATFSALLDPTGAPVLQQGDEGALPLETLCVLAAASFGAMKGLAEALGDRGFGGICHQGEAQTLYIAPLAQGFMLLSLHSPERQPTEIQETLARRVPFLNEILAELTA